MKQSKRNNVRPCYVAETRAMFLNSHFSTVSFVKLHSLKKIKFGGTIDKNCYIIQKYWHNK
jgi:hypothetical protein